MVIKKEKVGMQHQTVNRVIGKEVVGKFKGVSTTKKAQPVNVPSNCPHPTTEMKRGGNAHAEKQPDGSVKNVPVQWWTCNLCHSSWERHPLPAQDAIAAGTDLVDFGKHKGKTYQELLTHTNYTRWCIETLTTGDPHSKLRRYAVWAVDRFNAIQAPNPRSQQAAGSAAMEDEEPYPEGWAAAGSVAAASSEAPQHFQIDQEDTTREWTEAEIEMANRDYRSMMRDIVRGQQYELTSGGEFSETSEDQDL